MRDVRCFDRLSMPYALLLPAVAHLQHPEPVEGRPAFSSIAVPVRADMDDSERMEALLKRPLPHGPPRRRAAGPAALLGEK